MCWKPKDLWKLKRRRTLKIWKSNCNQVWLPTLDKWDIGFRDIKFLPPEEPWGNPAFHFQAHGNSGLNPDQKYLTEGSLTAKTPCVVFVFHFFPIRLLVRTKRAARRELGSIPRWERDPFQFPSRRGPVWEEPERNCPKFRWQQRGVTTPVILTVWCWIEYH